MYGAPKEVFTSIKKLKSNSSVINLRSFILLNYDIYFRSGNAPQTKGGQTRSTNTTTKVDKGIKHKNAKEGSPEMDSDSSTEVSMRKSLGHEERLPSPMSVITLSSGSRTPSPSPSYSSLSPDANSVVHVDAESSRSSDCEIIE